MPYLHLEYLLKLKQNACVSVQNRVQNFFLE